MEPILIAKCAPCHTRADPASGFAITYASSQLPANSALCISVDPDTGETVTLTQGACAIVRVHDPDATRRMPRNQGCTGDPALDIANPACLTEAEQQTLIDWINDGQFE
ncbi:hypothetical protein BE17_18375 [Sorangium cellulosum]|uniref:Cytochrome c domain-containing protein n=1 Tax=Sorangium cellulosum TaxID=56 RepID=A0A150RLA6_SORCE|nr:hypothetical protein BE17_18375 [Sorangium cellulosum]